MKYKVFLPWILLFMIMSFSTINQGQVPKKPKQLKEVLMKVEKIYWYGHASFRIEDQGKQIYIDPWKLPANQPKADYIFITHSHFDHYSAEDVAKVKKDGTKIIGPKDVAGQVGKSALTVKPGQSLEVDALKVLAVPAYNLNKNFHPEDEGWVGYVITLSTGESVYHAGDTDFIPEMESIKADIVLLPVGGKYTMDAEEAAKACNAIQPKVVIPMHWGDIIGSQKDAENFKSKVKAEVVIKSPVK